MKLLKLTLRNFKGMKDFTLEAGGDDISVYGDNATGKTTICDGLSWLLFGRDSLGNARFEIKTIRDGEVVHKLEHSVEGEFSLADGSNIKLGKVYKESWPKKRGQVAATFSGHTTKYFVDDVPVKQNEYVAEVEKIASDDVFKLLTSPLYFSGQLHWEKRREILLEVCGDITDQDIILSNNELADLPEILGGKTPEQAKKVIKARRSLLNKELDSIPVRVDEVEKGLPEMPEGGDKLQGQVETIERELDELDGERRRVVSGGEIAEKKKELAEIETRIIDIKNGFKQKQNEIVGSIDREIAEVNRSINDLGQFLTDTNRELDRNDKETARNSAEMDKLRDDWSAVDQQKFECKETNVCPTCNQFLPEEQVDAARAKALSTFNAEKAQSLELISSNGVILKQRNHELGEIKAELVEKISNSEASGKKLSVSLGKLEDKRDKALKELPNISNDQDLKTATTQKEAILASIQSLQNDSKKETVMIGAKIDKLRQEREDLNKSLVAIEKIKAGQARIKELDAEQKEYSEEFEKLEGHLYLIDLFDKTKVSMLEGKINSKFDVVRFKLFTEQINGGIQPCCDVTVGDIPYSTGLNNAGKINAGLDIINTLSEHYGVNLPVFIDNSESVVSLTKTTSQMIRLVVSGDDKEIRVERDEAIQEAA